jgi:peptidoglycan/LPS O-acetylase OafA/YrhL
VIAAAALSAVWRGVLSGHVAGWPILYLRTDTRADALLVGAALALSVSSGRRLPRWTAAAGTIGAIVILAVARFAHREDLFLYRGGLVIVALGSAALIAACLDTDWWLPAALAWPPIVLVGQLSYSLYLWHFPVFSVVADQGRDLPTAIRVFVGLAITFAIAGVSRRYVEMPFLRLKQKGARPLAASHVR